MAGFPVTCDKCGEELPDVNSTCPKCGPAPKTVHVEARAQIGLRAVARMSTRRIEVKRDGTETWTYECIDCGHQMRRTEED